METTTVDQYPDCVQLTSGAFRIAVTTTVGPRVLAGHIGDSPNIFRIMPDQPVPQAQTDFRLRGGHRLWHSPEAAPRTYAADNDPVDVTETEDGVCFSRGLEPLTGLEKSITIQPLGEEKLRVTHRLINRGQWPVELAPWALSVMAPGGTAVIPQHRNPEGDMFTPDRNLVLWPYTHLDDKRLNMGRNYIFIHQDPAVDHRLKIGFNAEDGWIAYVNNGVALVKHFEHYVDALYPDNGCSVESFASAHFCEIETLAPLHELATGDMAEHVEVWQGINDMPDIKGDDDVEQHLLPKLAE